MQPHPKTWCVLAASVVVCSGYMDGGRRIYNIYIYMYSGAEMVCWHWWWCGGSVGFLKLIYFLWPCFIYSKGGRTTASLIENYYNYVPGEKNFC